LREIRRQREDLDRREKQLINDMLNEDRENKSLIGSLLEESLHKIFDPTPVTDVLDGPDESGRAPSSDGHGHGEDSIPNSVGAGAEQDGDSKVNGLGHVYFFISGYTVL
jgi:DNA polymerase kappa